MTNVTTNITAYETAKMQIRQVLMRKIALLEDDLYETKQFALPDGAGGLNPKIVSIQAQLQELKSLDYFIKYSMRWDTENDK
jgi:hypothetical protein